MTLIFSAGLSRLDAIAFFCYTKIEAYERGQKYKLSRTACSSMSATMSASGNAGPSANDAQARAQYRRPSEQVIVQAGEVTVYDAEAKPTQFKSLYDANGNGKRKHVMIIFIRHFFCGV